MRNNEHYLSLEDTEYIIESTKPFLEDQIKCLPVSENDDKQNRSVRRYKEKDKNSRKPSLYQRFVVGSNVALVELDGAFIHR